MNIVNRSGLRAPPRHRIEEALRAAMKVGRSVDGKGRVQVDLAWVDSSEIQRLNRRHRGERRATDVLSFEDDEPDPETGALRLGEIVANLEEARAQAQRRGLSVSAEAALYAVHGLLHLLGMRDDNESARAGMRRAELASLRRARIDHPGVA